MSGEPRSPFTRFIFCTDHYSNCEDIMAQEDFDISWRWVWYSFLGAAIIGAITFVGYTFYPTLLGLERDAFTHSHQYIDARLSALSTLETEYYAVESDIAKYKDAQSPEAGGKDYSKTIESLENQKDAIVSRIRREADKLPKNEIPYSIHRIIN